MWSTPGDAVQPPAGIARRKRLPVVLILNGSRVISTGPLTAKNFYLPRKTSFSSALKLARAAGSLIHIVLVFGSCLGLNEGDGPSYL